MKSVLAFVIVGVTNLSQACTSSSTFREEATQLPSSRGVLTADRLRRLEGVTAFEALRTMPAFFGVTTRQPAPRFLLILDGMRTSSLDVLRSIQATDLFELRIVHDDQSLESAGDVEIVVTTLARHNAREVGRPAGDTPDMLGQYVPPVERRMQRETVRRLRSSQVLVAFREG